MKYKVIVFIIISVLFFGTTNTLSAQEVLPVLNETTENPSPLVTSLEVDPMTQLRNELAELKTREAHPSTGFVARFFIRIKVKELENKLNIATVLN